MSRVQAIKSIRWVTVSSLIRALVQLLQVAILARFLSPNDFGLMAIVGSVTAVVSLISDLGLGRTLFHRDHVSREILSALYWLNLIASFALMMLLWLLATVLAEVLNEPALEKLICVCSLIFPMTALGNIFRVLAEKRLEFEILSRHELLSVAVGTASSIIVAVAGGGVYALVVALLGTSMIQALLSCFCLPTRFRPVILFRLSEIRSYLAMGSYSMGEGLINNLRMQFDIFFGGALLGSSALGLYSLPRDLCSRLGMVINPIVTRVSLPIMAQAHAEQALLKNLYLKTLRMTTSVNAPLYCALALYAEEIITLMYGARWENSADVLKILAFWGLFRSVGNPVGSLIYAVGRAKRAFWWNLVMLFIFPPFLLIGANAAGVIGVALAMLAFQIVNFIFAWFWLVNPLCSASFREYFLYPGLPILLALVASSVAYISTLGIDADWMRLSVGVAEGALVYLVLSWWFNQEWCSAMIELVSPARIKKSCNLKF